MKDQDIVGAALASVLPQYNKIWLRVPHLVQLNLILLIPLLSSAVAGYDGIYLMRHPCGLLVDADGPHRLLDERPPIHFAVAGVLRAPYRLNIGGCERCSVYWECCCSPGDRHSVGPHWPPLNTAQRCNYHCCRLGYPGCVGSVWDVCVQPSTGGDRVDVCRSSLSYAD